jgi:hypothetical protein
MCLLFVLTVQPVLLGQELSAAGDQLYRESLERFEEGDFRSALYGFKVLKENNPGVAMHGYYAGRCLVELNEDLDDAIEWLYSASKKQAPVDVNLYLGKAYHRDYNFSEAVRYYSRFEMEATRQEVKELRVKQLINTCRNAQEITATYNQYEVMTVTFLDLSDSAEFSQIKMKGGHLQRKPSLYYRMDEDREGLNSLMFMPVNPNRGDFIFYSGPGRTGKEGTQLFRVKKGAGRAWGDPEEIKALNTEGDELLPYFDPIENDLYYASNGGRGIGGFDLFRAHYDLVRDVWTEPINLGFPINSVMDEYLLLPGTDLGMMMFFSTRQGTDSTVTVYRVHLLEPKKKTDANDNGMLKEIASLGGVAEEILADIRTMSVRESAAREEVPEKVPREQTAGRSEQEITPVTILSQTDEQASRKTAYQEILAEALMHQATSDSLKDLATSARVKVRESDDPNDRWVWQKQIMVWEKKSLDEEELADALYARMENEKPPEKSRPAVNVPETIDPQTVVEGEPGTQPGMKPPVVQESSGHLNRFEILGESPYSEANPIPVDVSLPEGVFYRIQLGAYGQAVDPGTFRGISPVTAETIADRGLIKYYAGKFSRYENASDGLARVRSSGYEDAFIVAWYHGNPISTQKAKQLE